jgi:hypothetical protein
MCERKGLDKEAKKRGFEELKKDIVMLKPILDKIPMDDVVKGIREDRDHR